MKLGMLSAAVVVAVTGQAWSSPVAVVGGSIGTPSVEGRGRWGATGFEGGIYTFGTNRASLNPSGTPIWQLGQVYGFQLTFNSATGTSVFALDFDRNGTFGPGTAGAETLTRTEAALVGQSFSRINFYGRSNSDNNFVLSNLTINGDAVPSLDSTLAAALDNQTLNQAYTDSSGQFGATIVVSGSFVFSGTGEFAQERPVFGVEFSDGQTLLVIPLPPAAWAGLGSLACVAGFRVIRRRRMAAN